MAEEPDGEYVRYEDVKHLLHPEPRASTELVEYPNPPYKFLGDTGQIECPMCLGEGRVYPPSENRTEK
jgi:hypothetical protein